MSRCECKAVVKDDGWREELWAKVTGRPELPIRGPVPNIRVHSQTGSKRKCLLLDKSRLSPGQIETLAAGLNVRFRMGEEAAKRALQRDDVPITLDDKVTIYICDQCASSRLIRPWPQRKGERRP